MIAFILLSFLRQYYPQWAFLLLEGISLRFNPSSKSHFIWVVRIIQCILEAIL